MCQLRPFQYRVHHSDSVPSDRRASVVRMELPVAALISAGFPIQTANTGAQAEADVVIGEDGRARAVRLISVSGD